VTFSDADLDLGDLGGNLTWFAPVDTVHVTHYVVYMAEGHRGHGRKFMGKVTVDDENFFVPPETPKAGFTHFLVYTLSDLALQTTPAAVRIFDIEAKVEDITLIDKDLDSTEIGGPISWIPPGPPAINVVWLFRVVTATDDAGSDRSQLGDDVPVGINELFAPAETSVEGKGRLAIFIASTLCEQTTPTAVPINDTHQPVSFVWFPDFDLDSAEIGGRVEWGTPLDVDQIVNYVVFFAPGIGTVGRFHIGTFPIGTNSLVLPTDTPMGSFTHFLVYTKSPLAESSMPFSYEIDDIDSTVLNLRFTDLDLDADEIGGNITWDPAGDTLRFNRVEHYHVYFALDAGGYYRDQVADDLMSGTNQVLVLADTLLVSRLEQTVVTCTFTMADVIDSVFYDGNNITDQVIGDLSGWLFEKTVTIIQEPFAYLVISGHGSDFDADVCFVSGFLITCTDGVSSDSEGWESYGLAEPLDPLHLKGEGTGWNTTCNSSSGIFLASQESPGKIWASGGRYGAFRWRHGTIADPTQNATHTHILTYSRSMLQEQTTPAALKISQSHVLFSQILFEDLDWDMEEVSGLVRWFVSPSSDTREVVEYVVYLAMDMVGTGRIEIGRVPNGTAYFDVPMNTDHGNMTHFVIYAASFLVEQSTPCGAMVIYNSFTHPCGELDVQCSGYATEGVGSCTPSTECSDCGLTMTRIGSVEADIAKGPLSILGAITAPGTLALLDKLMQCGMSEFDMTYYSAVAEPGPGVVVMCRYRCLVDLSDCQVCIADVIAPEETNAMPDYDGLSVWRYLDCKYRNGVGDQDGDLAYAYMFANGKFQGTGADVAETLDCDQLSFKTASVQPFDLSALGCSGPCSLSLLEL